MEKFDQPQSIDTARAAIEQYQTNKMMGAGIGTQQKQQNKTSENDLRITFKKEDFIGTQETMITTTLGLGQKIANLLGKFFCDLAGAIIIPDQHGQPELILYFRDVPAREGRYKGIIQLKDKLNNNANSNYSASAQALYNMTATNKTNRVYDLTDEAMQSLSRFMYKDGNGNINWNQKISEQFANGVQGEILLKLRGLNLIEVIKAIYGYKYPTKNPSTGESETNLYDFSISLISPVTTPYTFNTYSAGGTVLTDYAISIGRIDRTELGKVAKIFGQPTSYGTTPMCTPQD